MTNSEVTAGLVDSRRPCRGISETSRSEHDNSRPMVREVKPGIYECSGRVEIENLRESFHIDIPEDDDYQTLAGYILHHVGEIPAEGDRIEINGKTFTIEKGSATRLELIRLEDNPKTED